MKWVCITSRIVLVLATVLASCRRTEEKPSPPPKTPQSSPAAAGRVPTAGITLQPDSGRDCAVCHLDWVDSFKDRRAVLLADPPARTLVSDSATCLGCHDGSVADSRRRVWVEHGHKTGIEPPETIKVPAQLPLDNGKLACRTCHTAHSGAGPETLASTVFIRVPNQASQLCQLCHPDKTKGPELGTHPVGGMPWPVPPELLAAGSHQGPDKSQLICQTCHTPHGAKADELLVMATNSSQLCLTCHKQLRPGMWRPDVAREHPQNPPLSSDAQRQAIRDMGTKTGAGETLICLSCHKLHHGLAGRDMLADTLTNSNLCVRCHPDRATLFGTRHDLRVSASNEVNRRGLMPAESGPCGACHSFHQFARRPDPQPLDPTGLCATCHQAGRCAQKATGLPFSHPSRIGQDDLPKKTGLFLYPQPDDKIKKALACLTCHDPHQTRHPHFLRYEPEALCGTCHASMATTLPKDHDFTRSQVKNGKGRTAAETGKCGFCHAVHNANGPYLWAATKDRPTTPNELCTSCHRAQGMTAEGAGENLRHPTGPETAGISKLATLSVPLFNADLHKTKEGFMTCSSCHDPHGRAPREKGRPPTTQAKSPPHMLRITQSQKPTALCNQCHTNASNIEMSLHRPGVFKTRARDESCAPCHIVHARPGAETAGMWAAPLGPEGQPLDLRKCTGCHSSGGIATIITPTNHPLVPFQNTAKPGDPGFLPLFDDHGNVDPLGRIGCATCHLPHGRPAAPNEPQPDPRTVSLEQLRPLRPMVRPYIAPNVCSGCHEFDGLRRYLYYHQPGKRAAAR